MKKIHLTFLCLALVCAAGALSAQTQGVDKSTLTFFAQVNGQPLTQTLNVTGSGNFAAIWANASVAWSKVNPGGGTAPSALTVAADPTGLSAGTYQNTLLIVNTSTLAAVSVAVSMTVSNIGVTPSSVQFASQQGATQPATQTITLNGPSTTFIATGSTSTGGNWLQVTPTSGTSPGTISASLVVGAVQNLATGTYNGNIAITPTSGGSTAPINIPVTLTVSPTPPVTVSPASIALSYQIGGSNNSAQQAITISTTGVQGVPFTFVASADNNPSGRVWFTVSPSAGGTIPANGSAQLTVAYDTTAALPASPTTYNGKITLATPGGTPAQQDIPVKLTVSASPLLSLSAGTLNFTYQIGTAAPAAQNVTVNSTNGAASLSLAPATASGSGNWLIVPATATAGTAFPVSINASGLSPGTYAGTVTVTSAGAANTPQTINVTLKVTNDPVIVVSANGCSTATMTSCPMIFAYQTTGQSNPPPQNIQISSSTGATLSYTATTATTTCGAAWLGVGGFVTGSTSGTVTVSVNPAGIAAGTKCDGSISISATNPSNSNAAAPNSPLTIPVSMYVSSTPLLVFSPSALTFSTQVNGATPPLQAIALNSTSATDQVSYTVVATTITGGNWLFVSPLAATTGAGGSALSVVAVPGILSAGGYSGTITITATGPGGAAVADSPVTIPVVFNVNAGTISADKTSLNFAQLAGGPAPAAQSVNIAGTPGPINFAATASTDNGGSWLTAAANVGATPASVQVSASAGTLQPGTYTGRVVITAATPPGATGSPIVIPVSFTVTSSQTISTSPSSVAFAFTVGGTAPASQTVAVASTGGASPYSVKIDQGTGTWLTVTPTSGNTPASLAFAADPKGLVAGRYTATATISSSASLTPATVNVTFIVSVPVPPVLVALKNAASYSAGALSPGENVVIGGSLLGPDTLAGLTLSSPSAVATTVSETQVTFDGIPAPIVYVSATQSSVMVPYEVGGRPTTTVRVVYKGVASDPVTYNVTAAAPGIYTQNSQGTGPGAILNQDNSVNGPSNAAAKNSVVAVYMTGEGSTTPPSATGGVAGTSGNGLNKPTLPVTATVGGQRATVEYYGSAPGLIYGVMQVNVRIPQDAASGALPIVISVGSTPTQGNVTVSVK